jgi:SAM-dependent methyltransferase
MNVRFDRLTERLRSASANRRAVGVDAAIDDVATDYGVASESEIADGRGEINADHFARVLQPARPTPDSARSVAHQLYSRLSVEQIAQVERLIAAHEELVALYGHDLPAPAREQVLLQLGAWLECEPLLSTTGLRRFDPPEMIHAMARGPLAAAGGLYEADLIAEVLADAGSDPASLGDALDFGCSSGRVLNVLSAAFPDVRWHGCDPNEQAVAWASEQLPGVTCFASPGHPPLGLAAGSFDLIYAISIWSHFAPALGLRWFEEMHRLLRPGGLLLITTHGFFAIQFFAAGGHRSPSQSQEILASLYREGTWYAAEFGEEGDWGVKDPEWGTAFLSPEWLLAQLCPRFELLAFAPGRNQENQDVYLLRRP